MTHLRGDEGVVRPLLVEELLMCPQLHHNPILNHSYKVSVLDGGQPVGYNDACATLTRLIQSILHYLLTGQRGTQREVSKNVIFTIFKQM